LHFERGNFFQNVVVAKLLDEIVSRYFRRPRAEGRTVGHGLEVSHKGEERIHFARCRGSAHDLGGATRSDVASAYAAMTEPKTPLPGSSVEVESELPEELRKRLDSLDLRLATIDDYSLLGLARTATRAQIRSAFLTAAPAFHPDRYFGKNIGAVYAAKMQRVFARMAMAHDMLLDDAQRAKYDQSLPAPLASLLIPPVPEKRPSERPVRSPESSPSLPASSPPSSSPPGSVRPRAPSISPDVDRARAQAFAARLAGGSTRLRGSTPVQAFQGATTPKPGQSASPTSSGSNPAVDPQMAVDALRRRYEQSRAQTHQAPAQAQAAEKALGRGDYAEAARLYQAAVAQTSDPAAKAHLEQAAHHAKEQLRALDIARAKEAEQRQEFESAGVAWVRAFDSAPSAELANRAALCFRRAGTDLHKATKYGEEAVKRDPSKATYRVTLALAYADAGLGLRARGEIERALALEPQNASVKEAAARIKSMG
jgi:curved DNA-binding protein CbpA